jgi:hypothetical protein
VCGHDEGHAEGPSPVSRYAPTSPPPAESLALLIVVGRLFVASLSLPPDTNPYPGATQQGFVTH